MFRRRGHHMKLFRMYDGITSNKPNLLAQAQLQATAKLNCFSYKCSFCHADFFEKNVNDD